MDPAADTLFEVPIEPVGENTGGRIVCTEHRPKVYLLTFSNGPENRLVTPFCDAFILALDILEYVHPPGVVITTSALSKAFSHGIDHEHARSTNGKMVETLNALWHRLLTYPRPTVALINGNAFAGGLVLAMMHDYRVMNPHKGTLSLNAIELGLPLRPPVMAVFRAKTNSAVGLRRLVLEAGRFKALDALQEGFIDHLGDLSSALSYIDELKLIRQAEPTPSGECVYGDLKREMWREAITFLESPAEEIVRGEGLSTRRESEQQAARRRVREWQEEVEKRQARLQEKEPPNASE